MFPAWQGVLFKGLGRLRNCLFPGTVPLELLLGAGGMFASLGCPLTTAVSLCSLHAPYTSPFPTASLFLSPCQSSKDQHDDQVTQDLSRPLLCLPSSFPTGILCVLLIT